MIPREVIIINQKGITVLYLSPELLSYNFNTKPTRRICERSKTLLWCMGFSPLPKLGDMKQCYFLL